MKTFKLIAVAALFAIGFAACEKSESIKNDSETSINNRSVNGNSLYNEKNPYDSYGLKMVDFFIAEKAILSNPIFKDKKKYDEAFDSLLNKYKDILYPKFDTLDLDEYQTTILSKYFGDVNSINLIELSFSTEERIINDDMLSKKQKDRLLLVVSQFKFMYFYTGEIVFPDLMSWESRFDNCMGRELGDIFADDGNFVPEAGFIFGMPESMLWLEAECAWEASFC